MTKSAHQASFPPAVGENPAAHRLNASPRERKHWQLPGGGYAIEWTDLDEHIGITGLLAGRRSGESKRSFSRWLATREKA